MEEPTNYDKKQYKFGILYHHKDNPKLFVPKGDGLGWTLNFANKWSYLVLAIILGFAVAMVVIATSNQH